jgi:aurora kinase
VEWTDEERRKTLCGTSEYMPPEVLKENFQDNRVDIWALGILLYELFHKKSPFTGKRPKEILNKITIGKIGFKTVPPEAKDLILRILRVNPEERPTISKFQI